MRIENRIVDILKYSDLDVNEPNHICNSIIKTIDFDLFEFERNVIIEGCIIDFLHIHSCWFIDGLVLKNCIIKNYVDYQMGGHNEKPILIENNIFNEFMNFFDCQFGDIVEVKNNVFMKGSNLLGNKEEGYHNTFDKGVIEKSNIGKIDLDRVVG